MQSWIISRPCSPVVLVYIGSVSQNSSTQALQATEGQTEELRGHVIIAGFGRVGQIIGQLLAERLIPFVAVDVRMDCVQVSQSTTLSTCVFLHPCRHMPAHSTSRRLIGGLHHVIFPALDTEGNCGMQLRHACVQSSACSNCILSSGQQLWQLLHFLPKPPPSSFSESLLSSDILRERLATATHSALRS